MHADYGMMMPADQDPKAALIAFCQRFCKRSINKMDIQYNSAKVHPNGTQATVKLHCLQGQEFAGEICNNAKDAERSAAQQALQFYAVDVASLPNIGTQAASAAQAALQMPRGFGGAEAWPSFPEHDQAAQMAGMSGMAAQQLLAMSGMPGSGSQGRASGAFQGQPGQGAFGPGSLHMMGQGSPGFSGGAGSGTFTMPGSAAGMGVSSPVPDRPRGPLAGSGGGAKGAHPSGGKGGANRKPQTGKGLLPGDRPGNRSLPQNLAGQSAKAAAQKAKASAPPLLGGPKAAPAPAPAPKAPADSEDKENEAVHETNKSGLNVACMKILKRPMQKGEIIYDSPQIAGGFQSVVRLPCLPGEWGQKQWAGKVSMTRKAAEQDAAEQALMAIRANPEFLEILNSELPSTKSSGKKNQAGEGKDGEKGKGKGKGKGKFKGMGKMGWFVPDWVWSDMGMMKGGPGLPREVVTEELVLGEVTDWKGNFGWIKPMQPVDHPAAARRDGKIYIHKTDIGELESLAAGDQVTFTVYVDSSGLGAAQLTKA